VARCHLLLQKYDAFDKAATDSVAAGGHGLVMNGKLRGTCWKNDAYRQL
jgi:hypothetical protein